MLIELVMLIIVFCPVIIGAGWFIKVIIEEDNRYNESREIAYTLLAKERRKVMQGNYIPLRTNGGYEGKFNRREARRFNRQRRYQ